MTALIPYPLAAIYIIAAVTSIWLLLMWVESFFDDTRTRRTRVTKLAEKLMQTYINNPTPATWEASWFYICKHKIRQGEVDHDLFVRWLDVSRNPHLGGDPDIGPEDRGERDFIDGPNDSEPVDSPFNRYPNNHP